MELLLSALADAPIIPVVTLEHATDAVPLARALIGGGIRAIEITLRTPAGMDAIRAVADSGLDILLGAGTVTSVEHMRQAAEAGARFIVSPGATPALLAASREVSIPYLPGVVTPSEIVQAAEHGQKLLKFFPAGAFGGPSMLRHYAAVFPDIRFCPTGGVSPENMRDYLALPNVPFVGGAWLTPSDALKAKDWPRVTRIAEESIAAISASS